MVLARAAPPGKPLGRSALQVHRRGASADDHVARDRPVVDYGLYGCLPTRDSGYLVEQDDAGTRMTRETLGAPDRLGQLGVGLTLDQIECQVED